MDTKQVVAARGTSRSGVFRSLVVLSLASAWLLSAPHEARADDLIQAGQITLNPSTSPVELTLQGPATDSAAANQYGLTLSYFDALDTANPPSSAVFQLQRLSGQYQWQFTSLGSGSTRVGRLAMQLDNGHVLTLYSPSNGESAIVLDPGNGQITIGGSPVLTVASAATTSLTVSALHATELFLPPTSDPNTGIFFQNAMPFIHSYGTDNVFLGANAGNFGLDPVNASDNLGIGSSALTNLQTGTGNTALGANALRYETTGASNMAIGSNALYNNTTGSNNLAIGNSAMGGPSPITGICNIAIGRAAGYSWTTGGNNLAIGYNAFNNSDGGWGVNVAIGNGAFTAASGNLLENTGIGYTTLANMVDARYNTAIGGSAGNAITTGWANTLIGDRVGVDFTDPAPPDPTNTGLTTGSNNTFIGAQAGLASPTQQSNSTAIGYGAQVGGNNSVAIGYLATVSADNAIVLGQAGANPAINVGIGTPTPQTPLDVVGDATVRGVLRVPAAGDVGMGAFTNGTNPTPN